MPIVKKFSYTSHPDFDYYGLKPTWIKGGEAATEVAHDMLEHFSSEDIPGVEGELMALGAFVLLRLEQGAESQYSGSNAEYLGHSLVSIVEWAIQNHKLPIACKSKSLSDDYRWADDTMKEAVQLLPGLLESNGMDDSVIPSVSELNASVLPWIRCGYRRALLRYSRMDHYFIGTSLFKKLNKFSSELVSSGYLKEGDTVSISVNPRNGMISARINGLIY